MYVKENRLRDVLGGEQSYRVPLYQRPYSWGDRQLARLWSDLTDVAEEWAKGRTGSHFTGSLVLNAGVNGPGAHEFLVVDGQQRLTTLSILLCAIRDHFREHNADQPQKSEQIHEKFLVDKYQTGDARLKLLPTQADRDSYRSIVDGSINDDPGSGVNRAYRYFRLQLELADDPDDPHDIDWILEAALGGLAFVSITAAGEDNVYRIFESLNNTGMKLTQGDLLRNYLFMRLGQRGDEVYTSWWLPMQQRLSQWDLEALFWLDIVVAEPEVKQGDIYDAQRRRLDLLSADEVFKEVKRFSALSALLATIRSPALEEDPAVRRQLLRLNEWGVSAADSLVLYLFALRGEAQLTSEQLAEALAVLESFLVRRLLVGANTGGLSRILLRAPSDMRADEATPQALLLYLSTGRKFFATDDQVREAVRTKPLYFMGKPGQRKLLLTWLEQSFGTKEPVDLTTATIEHVLPQSLTAPWREALTQDAAPDESAESIHEQLVHTLGNLTLTGYNSELSNRPFAEKREELAKSGIRMNAEIAEASRWGRPEIVTRAEALAARIAELWIAPVQVSDVVESGVTWKLVAEAVQAIPAGRWTTYGELATLASTYPQPVAAFVSREPIEGAWRVMQAAGTIAGGFRWTPGSVNDGKDPRTVLETEGVLFDGDGRADPAQRIRAGEIAEMLGLELSLRASDEETDQVASERTRDFLAQIGDTMEPSQIHGVQELMAGWIALGGSLDFGRSDEISCFFVARGEDRSLGLQGIWPVTIYPKARTVEVVFQYLKDRPPFDSLLLREQLMSRLNEVPGIDLDSSRIEQRPSFSASVIANLVDRERVLEVLAWFLDQVRAHDAELRDVAG